MQEVEQCRSNCRERRNQKHLFFNILSLLVFKNKENKQKRIYFNASSPKPSPAGEGLRAIAELTLFLKWLKLMGNQEIL